MTSTELQPRCSRSATPRCHYARYQRPDLGPQRSSGHGFSPHWADWLAAHRLAPRSASRASRKMRWHGSFDVPPFLASYSQRNLKSKTTPENKLASVPLIPKLASDDSGNSRDPRTRTRVAASRLQRNAIARQPLHAAGCPCAQPMGDSSGKRQSHDGGSLSRAAGRARRRICVRQCGHRFRADHRGDLTQQRRSIRAFVTVPHENSRWRWPTATTACPASPRP